MAIPKTEASVASRAESAPIVGLVFLPALVVAAVGLALLTQFRSQSANLAEALQPWHRAYYIFLPAALVLVFPLLLRGLRRRNIVLSQQWVSSRNLVGDLAVAVLAAVCGLFAAVVYVRMTHFALPHPTHLPAPLWRIVVLVILAPPIKEVAFRLYPLRLLEPRLGAFPAYFLGTLAFAIVDWHNLGASFMAGSIWYLFYRWRPRLIVPTAAHALANLIAIAVG